MRCTDSWVVTTQSGQTENPPTIAPAESTAKAMAPAVSAPSPSQRPGIGGAQRVIESAVGRRNRWP